MTDLCNYGTLNNSYSSKEEVHIYATSETHGGNLKFLEGVTAAAHGRIRFKYII
jgi:hypothetical protein